MNCPVKALVTRTADINNTFKSFFENLLFLQRLSQELFDLFFVNLNLPTLSDNESRELDGPITLDELHTAVKLTNRVRSISAIFSYI